MLDGTWEPVVLPLLLVGIVGVPAVLLNVLFAMLAVSDEVHVRAGTRAIGAWLAGFVALLFWWVPVCGQLLALVAWALAASERNRIIRGTAALAGSAPLWAGRLNAWIALGFAAAWAGSWLLA